MTKIQVIQVARRLYALRPFHTDGDSYRMWAACRAAVFVTIIPTRWHEVFESECPRNNPR